MHKSRVCFTLTCSMACSFLLVGLAANAQSSRKPGLYEVTTTMSMGGSSMSPGAQMPQNGQMPSGQQMPQMPSGGQMPQNGQMPSGNADALRLQPHGWPAQNAGLRHPGDDRQVRRPQPGSATR